MKRVQYSVKDADLLAEKGYRFTDPINLYFIIERANKEGEYEMRVNIGQKTFRFAKKREKMQEGEVRYSEDLFKQEDEERE